MIQPWRRGARRTTSSGRENYSDLCAQLPEQLRDQPVELIPQLWLAWWQAQRGCAVHQVIRRHALNPVTAHRLVNVAWVDREALSTAAMLHGRRMLSTSDAALAGRPT